MEPIQYKNKCIVTGGRDYQDYNVVKAVLRKFNPTVIIHGDCSGADFLCKTYAIRNKIEQIPYPYLSEFGRAGGPMRNRQMCGNHRDATLIAFPGGAGTASCIEIAKGMFITVICINENGDAEMDVYTFGKWINLKGNVI